MKLSDFSLPKSMKLSTYFKIVYPKYNYYKIIPLKSLRNYNSDKIISVVTTLYRSVSKRIIKENKKFFFNPQVKVGYFIYMEKANIEFYFIIPEQYESLLKSKISDVWNGITIEKVDNIPEFNNSKSTKYFLTYKNEDALSLSVDKRNNALLSSMLTTVETMEDSDKCGVLFYFTPTTQASWKEDCKRTLERYVQGYPIDKEKSGIKYILKLGIRICLAFIEIVMDSLIGFTDNNYKNTKLTFSQSIPLSLETNKKKDSKIVKTQIVIVSQSENKISADNRAIDLCESFNTLKGDNELVYKRMHHKPESIKTTPMECQNFLSLPGKELIEEHKIKCIDVLESQVPKELQTGTINIGKSEYRGTKTNVYLCNDQELKNLSLCITGSNRSGKTTLLSNIIDNCLKSGESCVLFDFCGNCELSQHMEKLFKNRILNIQCDNYKTMQGMGYNEININEKDIFKQYTNAKMQANQLTTLLNSVNEEDKNVKAKMDRFLSCASLATFISHGSIRDVFNVLQNYKIRQEFINKIPKEQHNNLEEYILGLQELNETSKDGTITGTKYNLIAGIIDRLNTLNRNSYIELMLKKSCENNINLLEEIQKSQLICIKMPEAMFSTAQEKDVFCCYWFSKLWLSLQLRKNDISREKHIKTNIFIDEIYQVEKCQNLMSEKLSQMPKFSSKLIATCHYLDQIPVLRNELKASNASYMILQGSNVKNFDTLKQEFQNLGYSAEDLLNLKRYHALCLLSYQNGYWAGTVKMPPPKGNFTT